MTTRRVALASKWCLSLFIVLGALPVAAAPSGAVKQLHALFDEEWERGMRASFCSTSRVAAWLRSIAAGDRSLQRSA